MYSGGVIYVGVKLVKEWARSTLVLDHPLQIDWQTHS